MSDLIKRINAIRNLPIQEDVMKYIMICELIDREGSQFEEKTGKWIPCSERLPEETGFYLVTLRTRWDDGVECGPSEDIEVRKMHFSLVDEWTLSAYIPMDDSDLDQHVQQEVLAWMSLPEPYKGVG